MCGSKCLDNITQQAVVRDWFGKVEQALPHSAAKPRTWKSVLSSEDSAAAQDSGQVKVPLPMVGGQNGF